MERLRIKLNENLKKKIKTGQDVLIMWGGGKDSTASLLLASQYAKRGIFNKLVIVTFENFLSTKSVLKNRDTIINYLKKEKINFEWILEDFGGKDNIYLLYREALLKTGFNRAICTICNIMSEVSENKIINEKKVKYRISGNTLDESKLFEHWEKLLGFKRETDNLKYNTLNGWSKVFNEWLDYFSFNSEISEDVLNEFRLPKPKKEDYSVKVEDINLFQYHKEFSNPEYRLKIIESLGWKLPNVLEGVIGTETDCMFPSIIFGLHLIKKEDYKRELKKLEGKKMMPKNLLYRGLGNRDLIHKKTEDFLNEFGISIGQFKKISSRNIDMPLSLRRYLQECLLPIR